MRILLVEDDRLISDEVAEALKRQGMAVDALYDGQSAVDAPRDCEYDCILLDLGLPGLDGSALLKSWRNARVKAPIIIITARDGLNDRIKGLDGGADDYLVKPFELTELEARIRAVVRRSSRSDDPRGLSNGVLTLNQLTREALVRREDGSEASVCLTSREYALLEALLRRPGAVLSREQLEERIYAFGEEIESNAIEFFIYNLRKKLGSSSLIKNVRGVGWKVAKAP
ncbi:MAG: response regulator transcription factor [Succinivibrio sp.]|jgi:two-component system OmpR family response regulator|nr:response regulator transcription factor [Succinivibrio sp.]